MKNRKTALTSCQTSDVGSMDQLSEQGDDTSSGNAELDPSFREDLIRRTAFARYEARHGESGTAMDDWLQAERSLGQGAAQMAI